MKEQFIQKNFRWETELVISSAEDIIKEYQAAGMTLTLRQLYYQFVSRDLIPNKQREYSRLGRIITDARMAGIIDWNAIEDRTRNVKRVQSWSDPAEILDTVAYSFKLDPWEGQKYYQEVWIEKEALIGVLDTICRRLRVPWFACKGYVSKSEMYASAKRMRYHAQQGREPIIIHLGDHDPSGVDMTRDIHDQHFTFDGASAVNRIALNMDQIEHYNPPPNPTKMKDSRSTDYVEKYGMSCWELDALDPKVMQKLVEEEVMKYRDRGAYDKMLEEEEKQKAMLHKVAENWEDYI